MVSYSGPELVFVPLGGVGEIGMNFALYGFGPANAREWIVVDVGVTFPDLTLPENPLVAVLEGVEKPGNVGAVLRSADAAGLCALVVADGRTDLFNPNAIRASLGTIFTMPVCTATSPDTLAWLRQRGLAIYAARVDGSVLYTEVDYRRPAALVLGSEAAGLSAVWSAGDVTPRSETPASTTATIAIANTNPGSHTGNQAGTAVAHGNVGKDNNHSNERPERPIM